MSATRDRIHRTYPGVHVTDYPDTQHPADGTATIRIVDIRLDGDPTMTAAQRTRRNNAAPAGSDSGKGGHEMLMTVANADTDYP